MLTILATFGSILGWLLFWGFILFVVCSAIIIGLAVLMNWMMNCSGDAIRDVFGRDPHNGC